MGFWILDFGFWIAAGEQSLGRKPTVRFKNRRDGSGFTARCGVFSRCPPIQNPKSKIQNRVRPGFLCRKTAINVESNPDVL